MSVSAHFDLGKDIHNILSLGLHPGRDCELFANIFLMIAKLFLMIVRLFVPRALNRFPGLARINQNNHFSSNAHYHALIRHLKRSQETKRQMMEFLKLEIS